MDIWVGTSGYAYSDWVGDFYPPGTRSSAMLSWYARRFPLVELNYTFYRMPGATELVKLSRRTPAGFQFIVKLHQSLSHERSLAEAPGFREAADALSKEGRLLGLLCQFPQRFHHEPQNLGYLESLAGHFHGHSLAVEFRHCSWVQPEVPGWLQSRGLHLVSVDAPALPALYPSGLVQSGKLLYVRFHSRRIASWHQSDKERYDYLYSDEELREWLAALVRKQDQADRALLLFNNCQRAQAAINAERFRELLGQLGEDWNLVAPFTSPPEQGQGLLFG